jgi:hypothetical protein
MTYTRNDLWRIKRSMNHLNKALDNLSRANGDLRPKQFTELRGHVTHATNVVETALEEMEKAWIVPSRLDSNGNVPAAN